MSCARPGGRCEERGSVVLGEGAEERVSGTLGDGSPPLAAELTAGAPRLSGTVFSARGGRDAPRRRGPSSSSFFITCSGTGFFADSAASCASSRAFG